MIVTILWTMYDNTIQVFRHIIQGPGKEAGARQGEFSPLPVKRYVYYVIAISYTNFRA